jgi:hypothetical protein
LLCRAEHAYGSRKLRLARALHELAEQRYMEILRQITTLSEIQARGLEPEFTDFEIALVRLATSAAAW